MRPRVARGSSGSHGRSDMGADARSIGHSSGSIHGSSVLLEAGANLGHRPRVGGVGDAQCAKASNSRSEEGMCQSRIPLAPSGRDSERRGEEHAEMDWTVRFLEGPTHRGTLERYQGHIRVLILRETSAPVVV